MSETRVVITKILATALTMLVGYVARRRGWLDKSTTSTLSRFSTDVALPALIFGQMLDTVDRSTLAVSWSIPLLAIIVLLTGHFFAWMSWRAFATPAQKPTFIFVVGIANWIYLPLPIVEALYGSEGIKQLLLCNMGFQLALWTVSVAILQRARPDWKSVRMLLVNPGLIATVGGIVLAIGGAPSLWRGSQGAGAMGVLAALESVRMIGSLTVPLAIVVTGAQLGGLRLTGPIPLRAIFGIISLRLIVTPVVLIALVWAALHAGLSLPHVPLMVCLFIAMMPVAVSCSVLADRYGEDAALAAQSILYTTLLSLVTVPALFWVTRMIF